MAGYIFGVPFEEELFIEGMQNAPDPLLDAMVQSGAIVDDSIIANRIADGGALYEVPFWNPLSGDAENLDGETDLTAGSISGGTQMGVVFGRGHGFSFQDFTAELSRTDPGAAIQEKLAKWQQHQRQLALLATLKGVFSVTGSGDDNEEFASKHVINLASETATPYIMAGTEANDAAQMALGDNANRLGLVFMHSRVATNLANKKLLEYWKYTDANGIERPLNIADWNGFTVVVDDRVPTASGTGDAAGLTEYTTYLLGEGAIRRATGRVEHPIEPDRDPATGGGKSTLYVRDRLTLHPNGFSFVVPDGFKNSASNAQLEAGANWKTAFDPKTLPFVKMVTNG